MKRLRRVLFGISPDETTFARRGFRGGKAGARASLERIGQTFLQGYHAALEEEGPEGLQARLNGVDVEMQGFAYEGAAMALALLDTLLPWGRGRFRAFLEGPGAPHVYMVHVGYGWVPARLRRRLAQPPASLDPLLGWLALDGYGFHEGYFHWPRYIEGQAVPDRLSGYARRVFDQGLGRSLWFVEGADVGRIPTTLAAFAPARRPDLWSGLGLACTYAGGVDRAAMESLRAAAGPYSPQLAQGAAFAAKTRLRAGNPTPHTEPACEVLCALSAREAADVTDNALQALPPDGPEPAYEVWRQRIQAQFAREVVRQ